MNRSKTDTYEQKLSRRDFDKIGQVLVDLGTRRFNAQTVISRTSLSSYLVYLMLGLLDERELVESPARGEYQFAEPLNREALDELWDQIPVM